MNKLTDIGRMLRKIRLQKEEPMAIMARKFGISTVELSKIEVGKTEPTPEFIDKIQKHYQLNKQKLKELEDLKEYYYLTLNKQIMKARDNRKCETCHYSIGTTNPNDKYHVICTNEKSATSKEYNVKRYGNARGIKTHRENFCHLFMRATGVD